MTAITIPAIYKDSIVAFRNPGGEEKIYRVKKFNPKSLMLVDAEGTEGRLSTVNDNIWKQIREATDAEAAEFRSQEFVRATDPANVMRVGNVVRWPAATHPLAKGKLMVVTKVNAEGDANLVPLGGTLTGEYFRSVPAIKLEKVDLTEGWMLEPMSNVTNPVTVTNV